VAKFLARGLGKLAGKPCRAPQRCGADLIRSGT
jgi:hypothetical protein